jgi:hypothetical protein
MGDGIPFLALSVVSLRCRFVGYRRQSRSSAAVAETARLTHSGHRTASKSRNAVTSCRDDVLRSGRNCFCPNCRLLLT